MLQWHAMDVDLATRARLGMARQQESRAMPRKVKLASTMYVASRTMQQDQLHRSKEVNTYASTESKSEREREREKSRM